MLLLAQATTTPLVRVTTTTANFVINVPAKSQGSGNDTLIAIVTLIAALVAAGVGIWRASADSKQRTREWQRGERIPRYASFIRSARDVMNALFWSLGIADDDTVGEVPPAKWDYQSYRDAFVHEFASVKLVGPPVVANAAAIVQYSVWEYRRRLERDPSDWNQSIFTESLDNFIAACQSALRLDGRAETAPSYQEWLKRYPLPE
jgi:hypothetical protein